MTVANYNVNHLWLQLLKHQQKINWLIVVLLILFLLSYVAQLTWRLIPTPQTTGAGSTAVQSTTSQAKSGNTAINLAQLKRLNLFGDLSEKPIEQPQIVDAPVTKLSLTLTGVVSSDDKEQGVAIIENRGKQETYGVGEKIAGTNATLREVYADRVIIRNGPLSETLMLDGLDYTKPVFEPDLYSQDFEHEAPPENDGLALGFRDPVPSSQRRTLSGDAIDATRQLQQQPANFTNFIAVAPHRPNGELVGYRVSPGKDPSLFQSAGMQTGDVITEINGLDLTDMQQALEAMNSLQSAQQLQMTINREGELLTIYLDLPSTEQEI